jgi:hypothetical protein
MSPILYCQEILLTILTYNITFWDEQSEKTDTNIILISVEAIARVIARDQVLTFF